MGGGLLVLPGSKSQGDLLTTLPESYRHTQSTRNLPSPLLLFQEQGQE